MTEELKDILKYYDEIFIKDSLDKRIEDYCNKKHLYRLYGNKPVVMKEIKISLKEFAKQETELLSKHLTEAKDIIEKLRALYLSPVVTKDDVKKQDEILAEANQFLEKVK